MCEEYEYEYEEGNVKEGVEYYNLEQHPRAKELHKSYDINHIYKDLSIAEKTYFDENFGTLEYAAFFGSIPIYNYKYFPMIFHNIRVHALYKLAKENEINLYSFNSTAALTALKISPTEEVLAPSAGTFVIEYSDDITLILDMEPHPKSVEWKWFAKSAEDFSKFDKFFKEAIKKYNQYNKQVFDHYGDFIGLPETTFDDIFLPETVRKEVKTNIIDYVDSKKIRIKQKNGLPAKRGIIMVGDPGTGKTFLSRILAKTLNTTFMVVTNVDSNGDLENIFDFAKMFDRIILLFEDIDIYAGNRDSNFTVSTMLNRLDGLEVNNHLIVLCTTNNFKVLDKALKNRPGRFDRILYFDPPDTKLKIEMLKGFCNGKNITKIDFKKVVSTIPKEYTGAYLKELYITAVTEAIDQDSVDNEGIVILTTEIFQDALKKLRKVQKEKSPIGFQDEKIK